MNQAERHAPATVRSEISAKVNCWTYKQCGREPGGHRVAELGACPAATDTLADSINGGRNGGRVCWVVRGTQCNAGNQGAALGKAAECARCDFRHLVELEENTSDWSDGALIDFENVPLRAGARLQILPLQTPPLKVAASHVCHYGRYVGAIHGVSVLVAMPDQLRMHRCRQFAVRAVHGKFAYAFNGRLLNVNVNPATYIHLSYPVSVRVQKVRASPRVRAELEAHATSLAGNEPAQITVTIRDISVTGAAVETDGPIGEDGHQVGLRIPLFFAEVTAELFIKARIRNIRGRIFGVEFDEMSPVDRITLHYFVDYRIAEGNAEPS